MNHPSLSVIGARQHNLKNISCELPREKLVVITGPSGSGKSSLAFDTIHAEAYRRYVEFLPSSVRRSLHHLTRPDVDEILGLSPSVAMKQGFISPSPRATVGTITEILDYFRVWFARTAVASCPEGGHPLQAHSVQQVVSQLEQLPIGTKLTLMAPLLSTGTRDDVASAVSSLRERGFARIELNGTNTLLEDVDLKTLPTQNRLLLIVDRLVVKDGLTSRLTDSVELALRQGSSVILADLHDGHVLSFSETLYCPQHSVHVPTPTPELFSHTSPRGACETCNGLGYHDALDVTRVVPNPRLSLRGGALAIFGSAGSVAYAVLLSKLLKRVPLDPEAPWHTLTIPEQLWPTIDALLTDEDGELLDGMLTPRDRKGFYRRVSCRACQGARLGPHRHWFRVEGRTFDEFCALPLGELCSWLQGINERTNGSGFSAVAPLAEVIRRKLRALTDLGLDYLTLNTSLNQVANGELTRIRLSCLLGSSLSSVLYVLDEPTAGLHPDDAMLVVSALRRLTSEGNSVVAVDHSRSLIEAADWLVDLGPGAGQGGGHLLAVGTPASLVSHPRSVTGPYLTPRSGVTVPSNTLPAPKAWLTMVGAAVANLKNVALQLPLGRLTVVTGRSGAGKSSLVLGSLLPAVRATLQGGPVPETVCKEITGVDFSRVITFDQSSLGSSPRSTPATYLGIWEVIRDLFAALPESRARGYKSGRFSFNVKGGRCESCKGEGVHRTALDLMADVAMLCPECGGARFNRETLLPKFRGLSVGDVLALSVDNAQRLFAHLPKVNAVLVQLQRLGLGYLTLGQASPTLSGGEAQRVRFALELSRQGDGQILYLFDEPTSGLHFSDVSRVVECLHSLLASGHTLVVVEHNQAVLDVADWIVELGPGPGPLGGEVSFCGPPRDWDRLPSRTR